MGEVDFDIAAAKKLRRNLRLYGLGGGFALGILSSVIIGLTIGAGIGISIFFSRAGYVVAEIARQFIRNLRLLAKIDSKTESSVTSDTSSNGSLDGNTQENLSSSLTKVISGLAVVAVAAVFAVPYIGNLYRNSAPENLYNCEKHTIKNCKAKGLMIDCLFTNTAQVSVTPNIFSVWNYDSGRVLLGTNSIHSNKSVAPGGTIHIEYIEDKDARESVICSMDPNSPIITRSRWSLINNSDG